MSGNTGSLVSAQQNDGFDNAFFGGFFDRAGDTLSRTFEQYFPIWTAQQLGLQSRDQLGHKGTTYVAVQPRAEQAAPAGGGGAFGLSNTQLLIGVAVIGGAILLMR